MTNEQIVGYDLSGEHNAKDRSIVLEALSILDNYSGHDRYIFLYRCLSSFLMNGLYFTTESLIQGLERSNRNKHDQDGGFLRMSFAFANDGNREKALLYFERIIDPTFKDYQKKELEKVLSNIKTNDYGRVFPSKSEIHLNENDKDFLQKCDSIETLKNFLENIIGEEEIKTKSKDWRENNIGARFEKYVKFLIDTGHLESAEFITNYMPSKSHKWNSLKNLAIKYSESDLTRSLEITKKIKDANIIGLTKGLLGLHCYESNGIEISLKLISESNHTTKDQNYCRLIEKLIEGDNDKESIEIINLISHDLYRYNAVTFLTVYYILKNQRDEAKSLIRFFRLEEFKIKFLNSLVYFDKKVSKQNCSPKLGWFHFAPERFNQYEPEFWKLYKQ